MRKLALADSDDLRPYHHGDLSRALVDAARAILERDGPAALSLRAVAREAGVSPAAPYHHFKDKGELLNAVAEEGFADLAVCMQIARDAAAPGKALTAIGAAYVRFARANPAIYRVMYDCARDEDALPDKAQKSESGAFCMVRDAITAANGDYTDDELGLELACIAAWCMAHGLAEMASFKQFEPLKAAVGGEDAFFESVLTHVGLFR